MIVSNQITMLSSEYGYATVLDYAKKNLVLPNPEYTKKKRMGFWLGGTPSTLSLYETNGDKLVLPYGVLRNILPMVNTDEIQTAFQVPERIDYGCKVRWSCKAGP